jgi:CheY-like chemotaxis protein
MQNLPSPETLRDVSASTVTLPPVPGMSVADHAAPVMPPPSIATQLDPGLPPILVADDDPDDLYFIQRFIKKTGVKNPVRVFDDGSEVVNFLGSVRRGTMSVRHRPPLLLFLDLNMHGLGGFGFLEWAQRQKELAPLTIVVLSNSSCPDDVARALELGAHRYLVKYPSVQTFESIVRSVYPFTLV